MIAGLEHLAMWHGEHLIMLKSTGTYGVLYLEPNPPSQAVVRMLDEATCTLEGIVLPEGCEIVKELVYEGDCENVEHGGTFVERRFNDHLIHNGTDITEQLRQVSWRDTEFARIN